MKYAFAGDREISVRILGLLIDSGFLPSYLFISENSKQTHAHELIELSGLPAEKIFIANEISDIAVMDQLREAELHYIFGIHFPYIIPAGVLEIPMIGFLNLHPAYLPFNKGWNTPTWAIVDGTPYGATLHYMAIELDAGDIVHQKQLDVMPYDTANSLYQKVLNLEYDVFKEALPDLIKLSPPKIKQKGQGSSYKKRDLKKINKIEPDQYYTGKELIDKLRALTTNNIQEAAQLNIDGLKMAVQIKLTPLKTKD